MNRSHGQHATTDKEKKNLRKTPMEENEGIQDKHRTSESKRIYDVNYRETKEMEV